jgi:hypothetical protein
LKKSEPNNHGSGYLFWVCEKKSECKNHWFWLFQKPQRTAKEVMVCGQLFFKE